MSKNIINKVLNCVQERSPELLIGVGVIGMASSSILAVRATPRALDILDDTKRELRTNSLTKKEIVQATWKEYAPSVGLGVVSAACIILGTTKSLRRNAALATVYALSENTLRTYQKKTREIVGEEKAREIEREVSKARVVQRPSITETKDSAYVIHTGLGDTLIYDSLSGRYFRSSTNAVEAAINATNKMILDDYSASINDFYSELDIPTIGVGNLIGWKSDKELVDIIFDSDIDVNGNPYLILAYRNRPIPLDKHSYSW